MFQGSMLGHSWSTLTFWSLTFTFWQIHLWELVCCVWKRYHFPNSSCLVFLIAGRLYKTVCIESGTMNWFCRKSKPLNTCMVNHKPNLWCYLFFVDLHLLTAHRWQHSIFPTHTPHTHIHIYIYIYRSIYLYIYMYALVHIYIMYMYKSYNFCIYFYINMCIYI